MALMISLCRCAVKQPINQSYRMQSSAKSLYRFVVRVVLIMSVRYLPKDVQPHSLLPQSADCGYNRNDASNWSCQCRLITQFSLTVKRPIGAVQYNTSDAQKSSVIVMSSSENLCDDHKGVQQYRQIFKHRSIRELQSIV